MYLNKLLFDGHKATDLSSYSWVKTFYTTFKNYYSYMYVNETLIDTNTFWKEKSKCSSLKWTSTLNFNHKNNKMHICKSNSLRYHHIFIFALKLSWMFHSVFWRKSARVNINRLKPRPRPRELTPDLGCGLFAASTILLTPNWLLLDCYKQFSQ